MNAQHQLAMCYRDGEGVQKDMQEATRWFLRAVAQGHGEAYEVYHYTNAGG